MGILKSCNSLFVFLSGIGVLMAPGAWALPQEERPVVQVQVDRLILPCQVVDTAGNPVFDLCPGDIRLEVAGKETPFELLSYRFQSEAFESEETRPPAKKDKAEAEKRVVILLIDTIFSSGEALERAKKTAALMVLDSPVQDSFLVVQTSAAMGLVHVYGPGTDKKAVEESLQGIQPAPLAVLPRLFSIVGKEASAEGWRGNDDKRLNDARRREYFLEQQRYVSQIMPFAGGLERLHYLLNTWTVPRVLFLFSEGIAEGAFVGKDKRSRLKGLLRKSIQAIARTGTPVHTIGTSAPDPYRDEMASLDSGTPILKAIAGEGGGGFFTGTSSEELARRVLRQTAAYYELAFDGGAGSRARHSVRVILQREGIVLTTLPSVVQRPRLSDYSETEREAMAISLAANPHAMLASGQMMPLAADLLKHLETPEGHLKRFRVFPAPEYVGTQVDIFTVLLDPGGQNTRVKVARKHLLEGKEEWDVSCPAGFKPVVLLVPHDHKPVLGLLPADLQEQGGFEGFFERFKEDPEYQLAHVVFPFWRYRIDPEGGPPEMIGSVAREEWEHTPFVDLPDMTWASPRKAGDDRVLRLEGEAGSLDLVFRRIKGSWMLCESRWYEP